MGIFQSREENPYIRDRVRLCDGLAPLFGATVAAAANGRYVFILGDKSVKIMHGRELVTFKLDYIDLQRSVRVRLECVGGFTNFGMLVGFYALDERNVVLIDFNEAERTMRQRLIRLEPENRRTYAWLDRGYRLHTRALFFIGRTAVSEDRAITIAPSSTGRMSPVAIVYPKNPLNLALQTVDISQLLIRAGDRIRSTDAGVPAAAPDRVNLSAWDTPFFVAPNKVGFFTDRSGTLTVDPSLIVVCDIVTNEISIERCKADARTNFPYTKDGTHPFDSRSFTGSSQQLGLIVSHRCPANSWRQAIGHITSAIAGWSFWLFIVLAERQWSMLSQRFLSLSIFFGLIKFRILRSPGARIGMLNTRTLQWQEQEGAADHAQFTTMKMSVFGDGHTLIYDRAPERRYGTRDLGNRIDKEPTEEIRILSNPGRTFSLKTLSSIKLRKTVHNQRALEEIAARI